MAEKIEDFIAIIVCISITENNPSTLYYIPCKFRNYTTTYPENNLPDIIALLAFFQNHLNNLGLVGVDISSITTISGKELWQEQEDYSINQNIKGVTI